ncbi:MAG: hypothetical protein WDA60_07885, partial [Acidimicrobiia bacterium]
DVDAGQPTDGDGYANIAAFGGGYFAAGSNMSGTPRHRWGRPTIWWSADAKHWDEVVELAARRFGHRGNGISFGGFAATKGLAIVAGAKRSALDATNSLYASRDGRAWSTVGDAPPGAPNLGLVAIGADADAIYVQGNALWRVTVRRG